MIRIIDKYIIKEFLKILCIVVILTLGLILFEEMYINFIKFIDNNIEKKTILEYYSLISIQSLGTVLPIAFFISILYVLITMKNNNEMMALRAAGVTVFSITKMLWFIALFLMILLSCFNAYILPYASNEAENIMQHVEYKVQKNRYNNDDNIFIQYNLCFNNINAGRLWYMKQFSLRTNKGSYVSISTFDKNGNITEKIEANSVKFDTSNKIWCLYNGKRFFFKKNELTPFRFEFFNNINFKYEETPAFMVSMHKQLKYLSMNELKKIVDFSRYTPKYYRCHKIEYFSILSSPFICLIAVLIAVPFSLYGVRMNSVVGISKASVLFFLYYILNNFCKLFGIAYYSIDPILVAWLPNILMSIFSIIFYIRFTPR